MRSACVATGNNFIASYVLMALIRPTYHSGNRLGRRDKLTKAYGLLKAASIGWALGPLSAVTTTIVTYEWLFGLALTALIPLLITAFYCTKASKH